MTIPANLFVEAPEMQDRSLTKLDTDPQAWPEEIIQKLKERVPKASGASMMVKFMKKDDENGTATGSVIINSPTAAVTVPIIIKDFTLYPLDVMIAKAKILPLTPDYYDGVMSSNDVFQKIEEYPSYGGLGRFEDANLWNAIYPPSLGRYAYASAGYPMLDLLTETIDGSGVAQWLKDHPSHAAAFYKNGHIEVIKKVANLKPVNMNEFSQSARNLVPTIRVLKLEGPNKYSLLSSSDKVFSPALEPLSRKGAHEFLSTISDDVDDDINEVDQNGEKIIEAPDAGATTDVVLAQKHYEIPEEATEYDHYSVKKTNGVAVTGVVIPKVIDFTQKLVDLKIFIGSSMSTIQPSIWGVRIKNSSFKPPCSLPRVGQTGTFIYQPDKSHALATIPVTLQSVVQDCDCICLKASDLMGRPYRLKINPTMELRRIAVMPDGTYCLPKQMKWVVMEGFDSITNSRESYAVKTAAMIHTDRPVKLSPNGFGYYTLRGAEKYAHAMGCDYTNLHSSQAKFILACLGCPQEKIAAAFSKAQREGLAELHNLKFIPTHGEKVAAYRPKAAAIIKAAKGLKRNLFKEASLIDNAQTVDSLLSLNFVTPDNLGKFIGKIPHFKASISNLASALIASRLGIKEIPEEATSVAMERLIEVVDGLEKLRATQEVVAQ